MMKNPSQRWSERLSQKQQQLHEPEPVVEGRLTRMVGLTLEAVGCQTAVGTSCDIVAPGDHHIEAEVVGFAGEKTYLMAMGDSRGLVPNARVIPGGHSSEVKISDAFLGRVIDGRGRPLDGKGPLAAEKGAQGINLVGLCCTGNELLMRRGIPMAGNHLMQELTIMTGALEAMIVDYQCIMPAVTDVA